MLKVSHGEPSFVTAAVERLLHTNFLGAGRKDRRGRRKDAEQRKEKGGEMRKDEGLVVLLALFPFFFVIFLDRNLDASS